MVNMVIDNVSFELNEVHDFSWLKQFGNVFTVFDHQDSGNICFGLVKDNVKTFIKYAGAKTVNFSGETIDAVNRLKKAVSVYDDLKHPNLVKLIKHGCINKGYYLQFEFLEGKNLSARASEVPKPVDVFKSLDKKIILNAINKIFEFHLFVNQLGYVAIDFYDACIMYNFLDDEIKLYDVDMYEKKPYVNPIGRMWGSSRFMSPEEYNQGCIIDEITNVFNMGALAFEIFGSNKDRSLTKWNISKALYEVAKKAVSEDRSNRYQSLDEFIKAWKAAIE